MQDTEVVESPSKQDMDVENYVRVRPPQIEETVEAVTGALQQVENTECIERAASLTATRNLEQVNDSAALTAVRTDILESRAMRSDYKLHECLRHVMQLVHTFKGELGSL